ncbi:LysM domain/BON superfamily protein [Rhodobacteraceae bacterium THAF1]|uniref:LysM peptidoglycan-binding domain-containing protein n=1 Tax=Palleronia sp. THAF1 TaxID=2587842 RepID=UPI000F3CFFB7|nr:LysM peptidoglycan-binding domain-containing protein [Palleronia sp. THAF1]QFU09021.1 LysM domain/BON superfamily protein [Palleronia sp. THAF1]VDC24227.1 LysM domain/BON superfamily protein [Rhodobacteraceae bacterium THAF1]
MGRSIGLIAGAGAVVAVGALVLLGLLSPGDETVATDAVLPDSPAELADPVLPMPEASEAEDMTDAAPAPRIDTLRIEPDGMTLISGLTAPDEIVEVALGDAIVASGRSGPDGSFVLFGDVPDTAQAGALELRSTDSKGVVRQGEQTFLVEPPRALAGVDSAEGTQSGSALSTKANDTSVGRIDVANADETVATGTVDSAAISDNVQRNAEEDTQVALATDDAVEPADASREAAPQATERSDDSAETSDEVAGTLTSDITPETDAVDDVQIAAPSASAPSVPNTPAALSGSATAQAGAIAAGDTSEDTNPSTTTAPEPQAPRVMRVENGGLSVVQGGPDAALSIDSISYGADGGTVLGGRAPGDTAVRVYLDNAPVDAARSGPDGQWRLDLPRLEEEVYTLRVDQIGGDGTVVARAETPFKPEDAETLDALVATETDGVRRVTVQPGFTLWAIAERNYGSGIEYVKVFEANATDIGDPDLIYPGQIFDVPQ